MKVQRWIWVMGLLLALPVMGRAQAVDLCPVWIGVGANGALYELSPKALPPVKTDLPTLRARLANGCQAQRMSPSRVTSVRVKVAPHALRGTTSQVYALLAQQGWPRSRVQVMAWSDGPR